MNDSRGQQPSKEGGQEAVKCDYHPDVDAVGTCNNCKKPVCAECKVILGGETYCNPCANRLFVRADRIPKAKTANWFEEHLNWTLVLAILEANIIFFALLPILASFEVELSEQSLRMLAYIVGLSVMLPAAGWVLKKKNRSQMYLFLLVVPFGLALLLLLENRSGGQTSSRTSGRWF